MSKIKEIKAREIIDSRSNPTIEVDVVLENGAFGRAGVPSGASTGTHEALELRDGDLTRYSGKGVLKAVSNVEKIIAPKIIDKEFSQKELDEAIINLDGNPNKSGLGANAILGVSLAFAKASAANSGKALWQYFQEISGGNGTPKMPRPMVNILNGGLHAGNKLDFQEFMIVPRIDKGFKESLRLASETFHALKSILKDKNFSTGVGDEGGFSPNLESNVEAMELLTSAIEKAKFKPGEDITIAIDVAASTFYYDGKFLLSTESKTLSTDELIHMYETWIDSYPIISIEDGLDEDNWQGFKKLTELIGKRVMVVGDDLFATDINRLKQGIDLGAANAILVKLNQIGTVSETIETILEAKKAGYKAIISHRSGETEDTSIAHLAVGLSTEWIKTGSVSRGERTAKYNELLRIEESP